MSERRTESERRTDPDILSDIRTRIAIVENELSVIVDNRKIFTRWILGLFAFVLVQIGSTAYSYGQLTQKIEDLDLTEFRDSQIQLKTNMDTALVVLADHGTEIQDVRNEQARVRGNIDQIHQLMENLRQKVDEQTADRFYKSDGDRLEKRMTRIEDKLLK